MHRKQQWAVREKLFCAMYAGMSGGKINMPINSIGFSFCEMISVKPTHAMLNVLLMYSLKATVWCK